MMRVFLEGTYFADFCIVVSTTLKFENGKTVLALINSAN